MSLQALLWVIAAVLFGVGAFFSPPRVQLVALGLAVLTAGFLVPLL